jgi:hypothetical protein
MNEKQIIDELYLLVHFVELVDETNALISQDLQ